MRAVEVAGFPPIEMHPWLYVYRDSPAPSDAVMHAAARSTNKQMHIAKMAHGEGSGAGQKYN
jgi:hypothetical protein